MAGSLSQIAQLLGGDVVGRQVLAPGPGHSRNDRSLSVRIDPNAPDGFLVHSFSSDDFRECRDYVKGRLGIKPERGGTPITIRRDTRRDDDSREKRRAMALDIWNEARDPRGTLVERYLASRCLELTADLAGTVLRYHARCPWKDKATGETLRVPCMIAAMRNIGSDELRAVHRTRLTDDGQKVDRRMLGDALNVAIKLDSASQVTNTLSLGEGIETCMSARQLGLRPAWALGTVSTLADFPLIAGVQTLTLLAETDKKGANARNIEACGSRWSAAGRHVVVAESTIGGDLNDVVKRLGGTQ